MTQPAWRTGAIHIVQSLKASDFPTGERCYEYVRPLANASDPPITVDYWQETDRTAFLKRLDWIAADVVARRRSPIVQVEAHGYEERGLELMSGEFLAWDELKAPLTTINIACRLNLLVVVSACYGAALLRAVRANERAMVWALVGPTRLVTGAELLAGYQAFYTTLFTARDGAPAYRAMNAAIAKGDSPFAFYTAESTFRVIFREYLNRYCTEEALAARTRALVEPVKAVGGPHEALTAAFLEHLRNPRPAFEGFKRNYFMSDLIPEHEQRFPVSFEDCQVG